MKRHYVLPFAAAAIACLSGCAGAKGDAPAGQGSAVRATMDQFFDLSKKQDWDAVGKLMAPEFEIYVDNAESYGKDEYLKLLKADNLLVTKMALRDERIAVSGDNTMAWMTYKGHFENLVQGKTMVVETAETIVFRNEAGRWLLTRAQASIREIKDQRK